MFHDKWLLKFKQTTNVPFLLSWIFLFIYNWNPCLALTTKIIWNVNYLEFKFFLKKSLHILTKPDTLDIPRLINVIAPETEDFPKST